MMTIPMLLALWAMLWVPSDLAQGTTGQLGKDERELVRLEQQIPELMLRGDRKALEALIADDFLGYDPAGRELTKHDVLARMSDPDSQVDSLKHEDVRVRVFGNTAVATGVSVVRGRSRGQEVGGRFRYLRVWVRRAGHWQGVAAQSAALP